MKASIFILFFVIFSINISIQNAAPFIQSNEKNATEIDSDYENDNSTELYVIRAIVYEIGILINEDNNTDDSEESHEEVELTFYDPKRNGSLIALSNIPVLVQGQVAPINFGSIQIPAGSDEKPLYQPPETSAAAYPLHDALLRVINTSQPITEEI